jgi:hypothetical protein
MSYFPIIDPVSKNLLFISEDTFEFDKEYVVMVNLNTGATQQLPYLNYFGVDSGGIFYTIETGTSIGRYVLSSQNELIKLNPDLEVGETIWRATILLSLTGLIAPEI